MEVTFRSFRLLATVAVAWFCLALPAQAQDLTVFVGGLLPGSVKTNDLPTSLDNSPVYGVRVSNGFAAWLKLEYTFAFSNDLLFPSGASDVTGARGVIVNANLLVNIPVGRIVPYVTAGVGLISQFGSDNLPVGTKFAGNYGGGIKLPKLAGPIGIRIDGRGYTATRVFSRALNMFELSGGLLVTF